MILFKKGNDLRKWLDTQRTPGKTIGFVPTMGALHDGHLSLVRRSREQAAITVCSIFINPTQFNDAGDLAKYPVTIEKDIDMLEEAGCDVLFLPSIAEMYPEGIEAAKKNRYDLGSIEHILEGKFRPGHYQGVSMVVDRLLEIVDPLNVYLGQKDYQQCLVIRRLVGITGKKTGVIIVPTLREKNGLAMSSRNARLSESEKETASVIFRALSQLRSAILKDGETSKPIQTAMEELQSAGLRPEYVEVAHAGDLSHIDKWSGQQDAVILAAAWMNDVRLIDNLYLEANI